MRSRGVAVTQEFPHAVPHPAEQSLQLKPGLFRNVLRRPERAVANHVYLQSYFMCACYDYASQELSKF